MPFVKKFLILGLVIFITVFLLFFRLDRPMLWQDEGEVALVARNITKFGLPVAYDGNTLITQEDGQDSKLVNGQRLWSWNTWLPYYATALSFKIFGESTTSARLPFALASIATLVVSYLLLKKVAVNPVIGLVILVTNTLFYLYSRQSRYYAFSMLFPLCALYFYLSKRYWLYFLSLLASFHSNFVLAFGFNLPLIILSLKQKKTWLFLGQSFVWLYFFHPPANRWDGLSQTIIKIKDYLNLINSFYFPLILAIFIPFIRKTSSLTKVLILGIITHLIVISFSLRFGQRYLVTLIPVFSILLGLLIGRLWQKNKSVVILLLPIFLLTNLSFMFSERILHPSYLFTPINTRYYFFDYISSFGKNYPGPLEGMSSYLQNTNIDRQEIIYTDYEINSLRFYFPGLRFVSHPSEDAHLWLPRKDWGNLAELTLCQKNLLYLEAQKIILDNFDTQWENMPDITYHQFVINSQTPHITIYKTPNGINWKPCDSKI